MSPSGSHVAYVRSGHDLLAAFRTLIDAAEHDIVLQMYLFSANGDQTALLPRDGAARDADTIADWLVAKRRACPRVTIVVLLDSNTPEDRALTRRRGETIPERLRRHGVVVLCANLFHTRFDRRRRLLPAMNFHLDHPTEAHRRWVERQNSWQVLHNVEDHRKNLVIDRGRAGLVTSHNLIDAAFDWHENLFWLTGDASRALFAIARTAIDQALEIPQRIDDATRHALTSLARDADAPRVDHEAPAPPLPPPTGVPWFHDDTLRLVETDDIKRRLLDLFDRSHEGDALLVAVAYFSDTDALAALERAAMRGARVRVLIDSLDALPLPPFMSWLVRHHVNHEVVSDAARVARRLPDRFAFRVHHSTDGALMHLKTAARVGPRPALLGGQANYTPNSFSGAWLETNVESTSPTMVEAFSKHFDHLWSLPASRAITPPSGPRGRATELGRRLVLRAFDLAGLRP